MLDLKGHVNKTKIQNKMKTIHIFRSTQLKVLNLNQIAKGLFQNNTSFKIIQVIEMNHTLTKLQ